MNLEALYGGPVYVACSLLVAVTVLVDLVVLVGGRSRPCCDPRRTWRTAPDRLNGQLLPARIVAWSYIAVADAARLLTGTGHWWDVPLDLFIVLMLWRELQHRRRHRRGRRHARAAGRVVNLGHRLVVQR